MRRLSLYPADHPGLGKSVIGLPHVAGDARNGRHPHQTGSGLEGLGIEQGLADPQRGRQIDLHERLPKMRRHASNGFVSGDACVVDHTVPATVFLRCMEQSGTGIRRRDVQHQSTPLDAIGQVLQVRLHLGHVDTDHPGPFARQGGGDGRTNATSGTGHHEGLTGQPGRRLTSQGGIHRFESNALTRHICAARGQKKPQTSLDLCLGTRRDLNQLRRDAAFELFAQRFDQPHQPPLHGSLLDPRR